MNKRFILHAIVLLCYVLTNNVSATGEAVPWILLKRMLPENPVIVEAGAQFGEDSHWMSQFWPKGIIYAFEPSPESFNELQKVAQSAHNIVAIQLALSDQKGEFPFYLAGGASSLLCPTDSFNTDYFHSDVEHPIMVPVVTLDEWAAKNNVEKIDFLWLDMEGNELHALEGALISLKNVKLIYTEVNLQHFWNDCAMYDDVKTWMENHGFVEIWSDIVPHWHGNVLFLNTAM